MEEAGGGVDATTEHATSGGAEQGDESVSQHGSMFPDRGAFSAGTEQEALMRQGAQDVAIDQPTTTTFSSHSPGTSHRVDSKEEYRIQAPSTSQIEDREAVEANSTGQWHREYRFVYARAGDLTIGDVGDLLIEYKELVLKYVALSKAVEAARPLESVGTQISEADVG